MRRQGDKLVLRVLQLLVICQVAESLTPLVSIMLWGINLGGVVRVAVPIAIALYLGLELRRGIR